ncbi:hypothetical protein C8J56DRAFT_1161583 [Mycena floridula]|nr:hypothetical protein C8J56DRAFT_1161583 [Mycena floridula]
MSLSPTDLFHTKIGDIWHSFARDPSTGQELMKFRFSVNPGNGKDTWQIEKTYLDLQFLEKSSAHQQDIPLGTAKLWKDCSPGELDGKQSNLLRWLQASVVKRALKDDDLIIEFLTKDVIPVSNTRSRIMQGYLTKKGIFGGWKSRYFVLSPPVSDSGHILEEYDSARFFHVGGSRTGGILIDGAQFGRQVASQMNVEYRHAMVIIEVAGRKTKRHVLCARSDDERDKWVDVLSRSTFHRHDPLQNNIGLLAKSKNTKSQQISELNRDDDAATLRDDYSDTESTTRTLVA